MDHSTTSYQQVPLCKIELIAMLLNQIIFYLTNLIFLYDRNAHYQTGNTPLALVWKDENCSQYVIDTDGKGQIPHQQQVLYTAFFLYIYVLVISSLTLSMLSIFITIITDTSIACIIEAPSDKHLSFKHYPATIKHK